MGKLSSNKFATVVSVLAISISIASLFIPFRNQLNQENNELVEWAQDLYPLDNSTTYIIRKNTEIQTDNNELIPSASFYYIERVRENEPEKQQLTSGRKIGSSSIPLDEYHNAKVYIDGYHFLGKPLFLRAEHELPIPLRSSDQAVIHIFSIRKAEGN